ncbi:MAG: membrane protein insertase YidC [Opitutae bacterium]|nr:membrane protein insertase YidC [Opitutae bacterium]
MDKKNTVIGVLLLIGAAASFYLSARYAPQPPPAPAVTSSGTTGDPIARNEAPPSGPARSPGNATLSAPATRAGGPAAFVELANDYIVAKFTDLGGAIDSVGLKKHPAVKGEPALYTLNAVQAAPALSFADFPGLDQHTRYTLVTHSAAEVIYRAVLDDRLEVTRRYTLRSAPAGDPYQIRTETTFRNLTDKPLPLPRTALNLGTAAPINPQDYGLYLDLAYYDGHNAEFLKRGALEGGGFLSNFGFGSKTDLPFIEKPVAVQWAAVKNQFFASILTPDQPGTGVRVERVKLDPAALPSDHHAYGVTGYLLIDLKSLAPEASSTWAGTYYTGPKEYDRLADTDHFTHNEDKVMEFGFFGFFSKLLLTLMTWVHEFIPNWGWAIVVTTLILKTIFVPFTIAASRSSKRMQKLMPLVAALREKHKDSPAKANEAMMKLYKDHKVNPLGGCIPILITIPFFIGFFSMLQSASELRFAPFLWAPDLSAPDTVAHLFGLPLNIMPLLMGATMILQMRLTPTPTTDNAQATMMKVMPWIFTFICYNFSCALALYSFVGNVFTIGQQLIINRLPEPALATAVPGADGLKNVTPKKKK